MANSLLDFVMSLVRDPDAAARYAADPGQAIADAHLTDVTSADVNNLIPVVSESLSMGGHSVGPDAFGADADSNVWASGAATAAFDAFDAFGDSAPSGPADDAHAVISHVVDHPASAATVTDLFAPQADDTSVQVDAPVEPQHDPAVAEFADDWAHPVLDEADAHDHLAAHDPGFDLFT
jgi:hypothetical protein